MPDPAARDELSELLEDYTDRWLELTDAERVAALGLALRMVVRLDRRQACLVVETEEDDGTVTARPVSRVDWRFAVGALLTLVTSGVVPILLAHA